MKDKIILLPYKEAIKKYRQSKPGYIGSIIVGLNETDWRYISKYKFDFVTISEISINNNGDENINLHVSCGILKLWVPAVCVDFVKSDITDINLFVNLINILR